MIVSLAYSSTPTTEAAFSTKYYSNSIELHDTTSQKLLKVARSSGKNYHPLSFDMTCTA
jgi:tricorn protease-like protein